jgi:hypothetical protein
MNRKKILIIDKLGKKRDLSQSYIYEFLEKRFDCTYKEYLFRFTPYYFIRKYDLIYLGIYHFDIHEKSIGNFFRMDMNNLISKMRKKQIIAADQVDSEFFLKRNRGEKGIKYEEFPGRKFLFERYSSDDLKKFGTQKGLIVRTLPWMIKKEDYSNFYAEKKDIDVCFICTITPGYEFHKRRLQVINNLLALKQSRPDINFFISAPPFYPENEVYGDDYKKILGRSKIFVAEGSDRLCLTQKYLEAGISGCVLVGDRPVYPENNIFLENEIMVETDPSDADKLNETLVNILSVFDKYKQQSKKCIDKIVRYHDPNIVMNDLFFDIFSKNKECF